MKHENGIPLGGIGTGTVEIYPDGYFYNWTDIFNLGGWAGRQPKQYDRYIPQMDPDAFTFYIRTHSEQDRKEGKIPLLRRLGLRMDQHNLYSLPWMKSIQCIEYKARFPMVDLDYEDSTLPIKITATMTSPFIPHDSRTSGTPGFYIDFTVQNRSPFPVEFSLMGILKNPLAWAFKDRKICNKVTQEAETTYLSMTTGAKDKCPATLGTMTLSVTGGEISYVGADYTDYFKGYGSWGPEIHPFLSIFHEWRDTGVLSNTGNNLPCPNQLDVLIPKDPEKKRQLVEDLKQYAFALAIFKRYQEVDPHFADSPEGMNSFLDTMRIHLFKLAGIRRNKQNWGNGALSSKMTLAPGETRQVRFVLSWFFPHHSATNRYYVRSYFVGHMYANWFKNADEVNRFLVANRETFLSKIQTFTSTLYETSLDPILAAAWGDQLTTLTKCSWWDKAGRFAVWEGWACCGFHTMDITYQGSFNILSLFPDLQLKQMEMGAQFQRADGRVHHFFTPDLTHTDHGFDRVDMNPQYVMIVCRDYLWTGDKAYLQRLWPSIIKAMDNHQELDGDGDGLPDHDTKRNTYDNWNFFGTPSYIASLWLGALTAAVRMATDLNDHIHAQKWQDLLAKGRTAFDQKLWNGEYYSLWVDQNRRDECCMTDQMSGEWYLKILGLPAALSEDRIVSVLKTIYKYNFNSENGLWNATYPPGKSKLFPAYFNAQQTAPWTGIEYAIGSMMIDYGLWAEGMEIVKNIYDRHVNAGRRWNHVECGDHYYRAMSSWAVLWAVTGFKLDQPNARLSLRPPSSSLPLQAPWVTPTGYGSFRLTAIGLEFICRSGMVSFEHLGLKLETKPSKITVNTTPISFTVTGTAPEIEIHLKTPLVLKAGDIFKSE
jgi:uncharacterized protein (DUF608 family)